MKSVYSKKNAHINVLGGTCEKCNCTNRKIYLNQIKPEGMCMHAFHVLFPYILTFKHGGWFSWMKNKNKVEAQCPNPSVGVNMELNKLNNDEFEIKVLGKRGICPNGYEVGDVFRLNPKESGICLGAFDAIFPYLNAVVQGSKQNTQVSCPNPECTGILEISSEESKKTAKSTEICRVKNTRLNVIGLSRPCNRYHKAIGTGYKSDSAADGLCPDAFHVAYPYCLALLYNAKFAEDINVKCPNVGKNITMGIVKKPKWIGLLIKFINRLSRIIYPLDLIDSNIIIKIISENGVCPRNHKAGDAFKFNTGTLLGSNNGLCPASFASIYPSVFLLENGIKIPWGAVGQCPDCKANVTYNLGEINEQSLL